MVQLGPVQHLEIVMYGGLSDLLMLEINLILTHRSSVITGQSTQMGRRPMISVAKLVPKAQTVRRENQPADPHRTVGLFLFTQC